MIYELNDNDEAETQVTFKSQLYFPSRERGEEEVVEVEEENRQESTWESTVSTVESIKKVTVAILSASFQLRSRWSK